MIDDLGQDADAPIPLPNVSGKVLEKIVEYCKYHHEHPSVVTDSNKDDRKTDDISPWDKAFTAVDQPTLFELVRPSLRKYKPRPPSHTFSCSRSWQLTSWILSHYWMFAVRQLPMP